MTNAIRISPAQIPPAAKRVARRSGSMAIPVLIFAGLMATLTVVSTWVVRDDKPATPVELAMPFVAVAAGGAGIRMLVQQRRATLAAVKANADPMTFWYLDGFVVIPYIRGVPDRRSRSRCRRSCACTLPAPAVTFRRLSCRSRNPPASTSNHCRPDT